MGGNKWIWRPVHFVQDATVPKQMGMLWMKRQGLLLLQNVRQLKREDFKHLCELQETTIPAVQPVICSPYFCSI